MGRDRKFGPGNWFNVEPEGRVLLDSLDPKDQKYFAKICPNPTVERIYIYATACKNNVPKAERFRLLRFGTAPNPHCSGKKDGDIKEGIYQKNRYRRKKLRP